jgi:WD40 repeat protein
VEFWSAGTGKRDGEAIVYEPGIRGACLSGDERLLVTAGSDGTARVWNVADRQATGADLVHQDRLNAVACSQDGRRVAAGGRSGIVRLWDAESKEQLREFAHDDQVLDVALSPDERYLAVGVFSGDVVVWDLLTESASPRSVRHSGPVGSVVFSESGDRLATSSWDATARVWDAATLQPVCPPMSHRSQVYAVTFKPDGSAAATGCWDGVARIWQLPQSESERRITAHSGGVRDLAASPEGDFLVTGGEDRFVRVWSTSNFAQRFELPHNDQVYAVAVSGDGRHIASATRGGEAFVWDAANGERVTDALKHDGREIYSIAFSPKGDQLLTGCYDEQARVWDLPSKQLVGKPLAHPGRVQCVQYDAATGRFATAAWQGEVWLFPPAATSPDVTLQFESPATGLDFSSRDQRLAISTQGGLVHFVDRQGKESVPPLRVDGLAWSVQFHPKLDLVLTGTMGGATQVWDTQTGRPLGVRFLHSGASEAAVFVPNRSSYVVGSSDGSVYVCDLPRDLDGSRTQLAAWIEVMTGMELDEHGVARVLEEADWTGRQQRLEELGGVPVLRELQ